MIPKLLWAGPIAVALLELDIDGWLMSNEFLSVLANAITSILLALLSMLTGGLTAP